MNPRIDRLLASAHALCIVDEAAHAMVKVDAARQLLKAPRAVKPQSLAREGYERAYAQKAALR